MKILDILNEDPQTKIDALEARLVKLFTAQRGVSDELEMEREEGHDQNVKQLGAELFRIRSTIKDVEAEIEELKDQLESGLSESRNHMGEREQQTYSGWKRACKTAYPGCTFRGDKDIGAAVQDGKDVGEWDGAVGSVYNKNTSSD